MKLKISMKKLKTVSFCVVLFFSVLGFFIFKYEIIDLTYPNIENPFLYKITTLLYDMFRLLTISGELFCWILHAMPIKRTTAFIIGQLFFFPINWFIIYWVLRIISVFKNNRIKSNS